MRKIELEIVSLQSSVTHMHSYAVVLGEVNGNRKIPIVIGGFEAQAIAVALENLAPKRPLTHDLMTILFDTFNVNLNEVLIYRLEEGIFYAKLICESDDDVYEIDCRTSDAVALAIRLDCPIFAYESIIEAASLDIVEESSEMFDDSRAQEEPIQDQTNEGDEFAHLSLAELEKKLEEVLELEDYAQAIKIRDEINKRKA